MSRGIRLTDKGRAAGRQVQYRVYTRREGGAEHSINGPRRYAERKLQELRQTHPEWTHRLALSLEGGRIDWDAPELERSGLPSSAVFEDMFDEMAVQGVHHLKITAPAAQGQPWIVTVQFADGLEHVFAGETRYDAAVNAWEATCVTSGES